MRVSFAALLLVSSTHAMAQQTYQLIWNVAGFSAGGVDFTSLELDVATTGRYLAAHGAILTENRQLSPATGTCVQTATGYFCNLQIDRNSYFLSVDNQLNGKITGRDAAGNILPEATVTLQSKQ